MGFRKFIKNLNIGSGGIDLGGNNITNAGSVSTDKLLGTAKGEIFLSTYEKTVGGGSISNNSGVVEVRQPGNSSSGDNNRLYSHIFEFESAESKRIRANIQNVTIDNSADARIELAVSDSPDSAPGGGSDILASIIYGNGKVRALTSENGTTGFSDDTSQNNSYISGLNYIQISWDGSSLTVETDDGSTTVTVSDSSNYPSGETLHLKIQAKDGSGSAAQNVDFDIDSVEVA